MSHHRVFNGAAQTLEDQQAQLMSMPAVGLLQVRGLGAHRTGRGRQRQWVFIGHKLSPLREQNVSSVFEWDGRMAQRWIVNADGGIRCRQPSITFL
jgi:hypothetical protein